MALAIFFFSSKFISFKIKKVNKMQKELIKWYQQNKRDFPWRKDQDPYHIWKSCYNKQRQKQLSLIMSAF